jgi:ribonuclease P protein component
MTKTFRKEERLCSQSVIDEIFSKGKEQRKFPFIAKYIFQRDAAEPGVKIVISVPKKKAKHAVDRNRLRRQIKEAYRLNKSEFLDPVIKNKISLRLFIIYTGKEKENYAFLQDKLKLILNSLLNEVTCVN